MQQHVFVLEDGRHRVKVDADLGAHIVEFSIDGRNSLVSQAPEIGSTFWPSPQSAWGWPPPHTLDKAAYRVEQEAVGLLLSSQNCATTGLQVGKRFELQGGVLRVTYCMRNTTQQKVHYAPWEITRLPGGLTFYQSARAPRTESTGEFQLRDGVVWHEYRPERLSQHAKLFGDGSRGWLANAGNGLLLIKRFEPIALEDTAPGEAEIEIYGHADVDNAYIEMEQQGVFQAMAPGASVSWAVDWHLARLEPEVDLAPGSTELLRRVWQQLALDEGP